MLYPFKPKLLKNIIMPNYKPENSYIFHRTGQKVQNRSVLAAMTNKQSHDNGIISQDEIDWLIERAKGEFGIITTAATNVSKEGKAWQGEFGVYNDLHIPKLKKLTSEIHLTKSLIFAQLFHGGLRSPQTLTKEIPLGPSKIKCTESKSGYSKKASINDITKIIKDFTDAAIRCSKSGFDGIEIHGAHGYLISQFLGTKTNLRNDNWGGNLINRARLLIQICESIKKNVPDTFLIGVRISPEIDSIGIKLKDTINLIEHINKLNLDFIHLSCWNVFSKYKYLQVEKTFTEIITQKYNNLPTIISTGTVWSRKDAKNLLKQGADLVGVGRVAIAYPNWGKNLNDINYNPKKPPFTKEHLKKSKLNKTFIEYMRHWDGFVID